MADDLHYVPGDFYRICDRTGFKIRNGKTRKEWTHHIVRDESWEERHPQDFVRGVPDPQVVEEPRPRQSDIFIGPLQLTLINPYPAGTTALTLGIPDPGGEFNGDFGKDFDVNQRILITYSGVQTASIAVGDRIGIMLDNGEVFMTTLLSIPAFSSGFSSGFEIVLTIAAPLPFQASAGNLVTDYTAYTFPKIG